MDELQNLDCVSKTVGRLPLVRDFLARRGLAAMSEAHGPLAAQAGRSCGTVVELLVANRLQAPNPLEKVETWAQGAGVAEVLGMSAALLNDARLGRVVEVLGRHAPGLKGDMALSLAKEFHLGLEHLHGDLTTISRAGASAEQPQEAAIAREGPQSKEAQEGPERAQKASKVGLNVAHEGEGPIPISYEPLEGNASG